MSITSFFGDMTHTSTKHAYWWRLQRDQLSSWSRHPRSRVCAAEPKSDLHEIGFRRLSGASLCETVRETYGRVLCRQNSNSIYAYYFFDMARPGGSSHRGSRRTPSTEDHSAWAFLPMAGTAGLEPADEGVKVPCLTTWRRPNIEAGDLMSPAYIFFHHRHKIAAIFPIHTLDSSLPEIGFQISIIRVEPV